MTALVLPPRLKLKATLSPLALASGMAGDAPFRPRYEAAKQELRRLMQAKFFEPDHALKGSDFIAAHPAARGADFNAAVANAAVRGLIAHIGGSDSARVVPFIDWAKFCKTPKVLVGYSDITSLHLAAYHAGVQTYYGPAMLDGFAENGGMHALTWASWQRATFTRRGRQELVSSPVWTSAYLPWQDVSLARTLRPLQVERHGHIYLNFDQIKRVSLSGHLLGGCLDTLVNLKDAPFWPSAAQWANSALFFETSEQMMSPAQFRAALALLADEIARASFLIVGKPKDERYFDEYLAALNKLNVPVIFNVNIGHAAPFYTLPYGGKARVHVAQRKLIITNY